MPYRRTKNRLKALLHHGLRDAEPFCQLVLRKILAHMLRQELLYRLHRFHLSFVKVRLLFRCQRQLQRFQKQQKFQDLNFKIRQPDLLRDCVQFTENMLDSTLPREGPPATCPCRISSGYHADPPENPSPAPAWSGTRS